MPYARVGAGRINGGGLISWVDVAIELKQSGVSWTELPGELEKVFGETFTFNQVRNRVRRHPRYKDTASLLNINEQILSCLTKGKTKEQLCNEFKISERVLNAALEDIRESGFIIDEGETVKLCKDLVPQENIVDKDWTGDKIIRFGLCGDNQSGSRYTQWTHLHSYYDTLKQEGITEVYHTGDIDEGEEMRMGHKYECYCQGADEHVEEIARNYPQREGITTHFITGNHDHSLIKRAGYDIGRAVAERRRDMVYLGRSNAMINLTPNCKLEICHPIDGTAYALSYKTQKMIDAMQGGDKPNLLAIGHYHKTEYLFYRNIHAFQTGCFQAQTPWMKGRQIAAMVGGWIIELHVSDEGTVTRCKGEFVPFYKMIADDWKNWR